MKKVLLLLLVVLLAGCTLPGDDEEDETPAVFGACPHWIAGPGTVEATIEVSGAQGEAVVGVTPNGTGADETALMHQGRELDMFLLRTNATAPVELRVFALRETGPERLLIHHIEAGVWKASPFLQIDGQQEVQVFLADTAFGAETAPAPIRMQAKGTEARLDVHATPFYRVCGIPLKDPSSQP